MRDLETVVDAAKLDRFALLGNSQGCASLPHGLRCSARPSGSAISCFMAAPPPLASRPAAQTSQHLRTLIQEA